jgi:hypothetical protein
MQVFVYKFHVSSIRYNNNNNTFHLKQKHFYNKKFSYNYVLPPFLAMLPDLTESLDAMDFSIESETGRLINIANYANLTGYFVLAGLIFIGVFSVFLFIYDLKTATKRSGDISLGYLHRR